MSNLETHEVVHIDLTHEYVYPDFRDYSVVTYFLQDEKDSLPAQNESRAASEKAIKIVHDNNLNHALALWGTENSVLHASIATKLLSYKLYQLNQQIFGFNSDRVILLGTLLVREYERMKAREQKPSIEQALISFQAAQTEHYKDDEMSPQRARTIELAVNDLFIRVGGADNADDPFGRTTRVKPEILKEWTAVWQPNVWENLPDALIKELGQDSIV